MPEMNVSMSWSNASPSAPADCSTPVCFASSASVAALGVKFSSALIRSTAFTPGTSIAATLALKRACWSSNPRSLAAIQPAAQIPSS